MSGSLVGRKNWDTARNDCGECFKELIEGCRVWKLLRERNRLQAQISNLEDEVRKRWDNNNNDNNNNSGGSGSRERMVEFGFFRGR